MIPRTNLLVFLVSLLPMLSIVLGEEESAAHAIDTAMDRAMDRDPSTFGQVDAANVALERWNELLNLNYQGLIKQLPDAAEEKLRASQRAWVAWRDSEIEALAAVYAQKEGTMWIGARAHAVMNLTRKRALRLGFLRNMGIEGTVKMDVRGSTVEIAPASNRDDIRFLFNIVEPGFGPVVDLPDMLQYDIVLVENQAPASFVFYFDGEGVVNRVLLDAFTPAQNPTVSQMIRQLRAESGEPGTLTDGSMVWDNLGWTFTHFSGGDGEDSTFSMEITK